MPKIKAVPWSSVALVAVAGWAATRLGLMTRVLFNGVGALPALSKETPLKPGGTCPAGWIKAGNKCIKL